MLYVFLLKVFSCLRSCCRVYSFRKESLWQSGECEVEKERHSLAPKHRQSRQVRVVFFLLDLYYINGSYC